MVTGPPPGRARCRGPPTCSSCCVACTLSWSVRRKSYIVCASESAWPDARSRRVRIRCSQVVRKASAAPCTASPSRAGSAWARFLRGPLRPSDCSSHASRAAASVAVHICERHRCRLPGRAHLGRAEREHQRGPGRTVAADSRPPRRRPTRRGRSPGTGRTCQPRPTSAVPVVRSSVDVVALGEGADDRVGTRTRSGPTRRCASEPSRSTGPLAGEVAIRAEEARRARRSRSPASAEPLGGRQLSDLRGQERSAAAPRCRPRGGARAGPGASGRPGRGPGAPGSIAGGVMGLFFRVPGGSNPRDRGGWPTQRGETRSTRSSAPLSVVSSRSPLRAEVTERSRPKRARTAGRVDRDQRAPACRTAGTAPRSP